MFMRLGLSEMTQAEYIVCEIPNIKVPIRKKLWLPKHKSDFLRPSLLYFLVGLPAEAHFRQFIKLSWFK